MDGYIKLYRKILDNPVIMKDVDYLAIWIYLLLKATHKEMKVAFGGNIIILKPGQLITGRTKISQDLGVQESKVERVLKALKNEQQIEQQTTSKGRLITLVNWKIYQSREQDDEQQSGQQVNNERTTSEQQMNTNKNERMKECKNVRNNNITATDKLLLYYENNVSTLSPIATEKILELEKDYGAFKVQKAIEKSVLNGIRNLNYISGILKSWGDKSWDEILKLEESFKKNKNTKKGEFDWNKI